MAHEGRAFRKGRIQGGLLAVVCVALAGSSLPAAAAGGPSLGSAKSFAVLAGANVASTGLTVVTGNIGVSPGTDVAGFGPGTVAKGSIHTADAVAAAAHADASVAYANLAGMASPPANDRSGIDLGGLTLAPGVYRFGSAAGLTGALTLDAGGNSNALFVFQVASSLTTAASSSVVVINGGADYDESNIFWQIGASATLGSGTAFKGNILAYASVSMVTGATLVGNAVALNGAVTMDSNTVTSPDAGSGPPIGRPSKGNATLVPPIGDPESRATARISVQHFPAHKARAERSTLRIRMRRLEKSNDYTLWADDPATPGAELVQFYAFSTNAGGSHTFAVDTKKGDALPFGATLAALSDGSVEVRDSAGTTTVLSGAVPRTNP